MKSIKQILSKKTGITVLVILLLSAGYFIFSLSKPNTFYDGDVITAEEMNENWGQPLTLDRCKILDLTLPLPFTIRISQHVLCQQAVAPISIWVLA